MRFQGYRQVIRLAAAVALGAAAGHVALACGGPFAWVFLWLLGLVLCPLAVCLLTRRRRFRYAALANLAMLGAPMLEGLALRWAGATAPDPLAAAPGLLVLAALSVFAVLFALAVIGASDSGGRE